MRVLHIASFQGNLGDRVNHQGFRTWFEKQVDTEVYWSDFEIRDVYRKKVNFRAEVRKLSSHVDAIVAGGGGFWELWPQDTELGVSLDFGIEFLDGLDKPVFFNALGVDSGQGVSAAAAERFPRFLKWLLSDPRFLVTIRNDGSQGVVSELLQEDTKCTEIPDHAFFGFGEVIGPEVIRSDDTIALNVAVDMPHLRFRSGATADSFLSSLARGIEGVVSQSDLRFQLVPHIYSDLGGIAELLSLLPDSIRREKIDVSPLETTLKSGFRSVEAYARGVAAASMRFHGNVFGAAAGIPTLALLSYPKVEGLISGASRHAFDSLRVSEAGFEERFEDQMLQLVESRVTAATAMNDFLTGLHRSRERFAPRLREWLSSNGLQGC